MTHRAIMGIALLLFFAAACDMLTNLGDRVAIQVGDHKISVDRVRRDMEEFGVDMGLQWEEMEPLFDQVTGRLVERYLILAYGSDNSIEVADSELEQAIEEIKSGYHSEDNFNEMLLERYIDFEEWKEQLRQRILMAKIIARGTADVDPVTFQEIEDYYSKNRDEFRNPPQVRFRQIIGRTREDAKMILENVREEETLERLIRERPELLNSMVVVPGRWASQEELEETLSKALFRLPLGLSQKPVHTPYGYHVLEVLEKREQGLMRLPDVMEEIEERLLEDKKEQQYRVWVEDLKARYPVKIYKSVIDTLGAR